MKHPWLQRLLRWIPALIMLQTLYFKFTAHPQSVKLFNTLGMEPWGRIGTGVLELIAAVLLLIPSTALYGALLALALMSGAIFFHLTQLGIVFDGDAVLFIYAVITWLAAAIIVWQRKQQFLKLFSPLFFLVVISMAGCNSSKDTPMLAINDTIPATGMVLASAELMSAVHPTSGSARILKEGDKWYLALENFSTDAGPDLKVYLSSNLSAAQFINLGSLKSTRGNQVYEITGMPSLIEYPYVLIWCQQFAVLFGSGKLNQ